MASSESNATGARAAALVGAVSLLVYGSTLYPDVAGGDSGELVGAVATSGVIHPPGYPLYSLLGRLFVWVPFGGVARRLNGFAAVSDAVAAALLCAAIARRTRSAPAGVLASAVFAFAPVVWRYAICAEVFALNNLFAAALLYFAVAYDEDADRHQALAFAATFGLGLSNHHTILFAGGPLFAWMIFRGRSDLLRPKALLGLAVAFTAGLLPYVFLPLAAGGHSPVSWGATNTWPGFVTHVFRREYGTFRLAPEGLSQGTSVAAVALAWANDALDGTGIWNVPFVLLGFREAVRSAKRVDLGTLLAVIPMVAVGVIAWLGNIPVDAPLQRGIVARFFQEPYLFVCALVGLGFARLGHIALRRFGARGPTAVWTVTLVLSLAPAVIHFRNMDRHRSTLVRAYGAEILRAAPRGALVLTKGDLITNTVRYLQAVDETRPDVRVVDLELLGFDWARERYVSRHPDVTFPEGPYMPGAAEGFSIKALLDANYGRFPILLCGGVKRGDSSADATYGFWPHGFCETVHSGSEPMNLDGWIADSGDALPRIDFRGQPRDAGSWEEVVYRDYWEVRQARAAHLLEVVGADPARRRYVDVAANLLTEVTRENPDVPAHVYKNLAIAIGRSGLETADARARAAAAWRKYLSLADPGELGLAAIRDEVKRLEGR